jgi:hypothetical protein
LTFAAAFKSKSVAALIIEWNFVALIKKLDLTHICKFDCPSKSKIGIECDLAFSALFFTLKKKDKL